MLDFNDPQKFFSAWNALDNDDRERKELKNKNNLTQLLANHVRSIGPNVAAVRIGCSYETARDILSNAQKFQTHELLEIARKLNLSV